MTDNASSTTLLIQQIPLKLIRPNPANRLVTPDMVEDMAASLAAVGLKNAVKMRPRPDGNFDLFSGHVRLAGAAKLGWDTIAAYVMDITPEEAVEIAILDNRNKKQTWLDNYIDIERWQAINPKITLQELADRLNDGVNVGAISRGKRLLKCLNPASRALINQCITKSRAAQAESLRTSKTSDGITGKSLRSSKTSPKTWELTENPVYCLTGLEDPELVFKALLAVIDRQMTEPQAQKLVEWVKTTGQPPEAYSPEKASKTLKTPKIKASPAPSAFNARQLVELAKKAGAEEALGHTTGGQPNTTQNQLAAYLAQIEQASPAPSFVSAPAQTTVPADPKTSTNPDLFWEWMAGISIFSRIKSKLKHGGKPAKGEYALVVIHGIGSLGKRGLTGAGRTVRFVWNTFIESLKITGLYPLARAVFFLSLFLFFGWFAWKSCNYGIILPCKIIASRLRLPFLKTGSAAPSAETSAADPQTPQPVIPAEAPKARPAPAPAKTSGPVYESMHPYQPSDEDEKYLEAEISALPFHSRVKDFPFQPAVMEPDMAGRRLQDILSAEKFTMLVGHDTQRILSVIPSTTDLAITYQGGLLGGLLGGPSKMDFYWEDVQAIHCDEIDAAPDAAHAHVLYQFGLVAAGLKTPLILQCASAGDLKHFVSALEFWLKAARRGQGAPLAGLPYPNQGFWLDGSGSVAALWADSPADKATLKLGEVVWSLGKNTVDPRDRGKLRAELSSGPADLFVVTAEDWAKFQAHQSMGLSAPFNPKRRKVQMAD